MLPEFPQDHQCEAADCEQPSVEGFEIKLNLGSQEGNWQRFCCPACRASAHAAFLVLHKGYKAGDAETFANAAEKKAEEAQKLADEMLDDFSEN